MYRSIYLQNVSACTIADFYAKQVVRSSRGSAFLPNCKKLMKLVLSTTIKYRFQTERSSFEVLWSLRDASFLYSIIAVNKQLYPRFIDQHARRTSIEKKYSLNLMMLDSITFNNIFLTDSVRLKLVDDICRNTAHLYPPRTQKRLLGMRHNISLR